MTEENKALVRRFYEAFGAADMPTLQAVLAPDLVAYTHAQPTPLTQEQQLQTITTWLACFDTRFDVEEQIAEGEAVATRVTMVATHNRGEFMGVPPSGKEIVTSGISIERIQDGRIIHRRVESDWLGMMQQLGLVAMPGATLQQPEEAPEKMGAG